MSQNSLVDMSSSGVQSDKSGLTPALADALASLEVQLDQELARYRRTRTVYKTTSSPQKSNSTSKPQLSAISVTRGEKQPVNTATATTPNKEVSPEIKTSTKTSIPETQQKVPASATALSTSLQQIEAPNFGEASTLEEAALPLADVSSKTKQEHPLQESTPSDAKKPNASIVPASVEQHKISKHIPDNTQPPDDYLESSEALLRSLAEEQPKTHKQTNSSDSLLSPLGIGSILLLLVSSLTLGYVVFNPKTLPQFNLSGLFKRKAELNAENTEFAEKNIKNVAQPPLTPIPKYPNLATDEFPEVRDPIDVVGLKPNAKATPTVSPKPVAAQNPINPVTTVQTPQTSTAITLEKPSSEQQQQSAQITPSSDGFYHVVTDNQNDRTLASTRIVVPDAYLSSSGKFIYLGAVKNKENAQQLVQELQAKGIKARINTP